MPKRRLDADIVARRLEALRRIVPRPIGYPGQNATSATPTCRSKGSPGGSTSFARSTISRCGFLARRSPPDGDRAGYARTIFRTASTSPAIPIPLAPDAAP